MAEVAKSIYKININELDLKIKDNINYFKVSNIEELYSRIGFGFISPDTVIKSVYKEIINSQSRGIRPTKKKLTKKVHISGYDDLEYSLAGCCEPNESDEIVAYITSEHKTKIHKTNCPVLKKHKDTNKIIPANWGD